MPLQSRWGPVFAKTRTPKSSAGQHADTAAGPVDQQNDRQHPDQPAFNHAGSAVKDHAGAGAGGNHAANKERNQQGEAAPYCSANAQAFRIAVFARADVGSGDPDVQPKYGQQ